MTTKKILAFDIGGTSIRAAIVENNKIKTFLQIQTPKDKIEFISTIDNFASQLISKEIIGIGVGIAGVIKNGIITTSPNLPIKNFNLKKYLENKYHKKTIVFNDAGCFSLAEKELGCKKKNFFLITLGTGIGGGLVINGETYRGGTGLGGELGHTLINGKDWELQWKETRKKIQQEFGEKALIKDLVKIKSQKSLQILEEAADYLGQGIASIITILDPEIVILAGGPKESGNLFLNMIKQKVKKYSFLPKTTPIKWTKLTHPGTLGASLLVK